MPSVIVVGSANLDLVANVDRIPGPGETLLATGYAEHAGGKGLNQAVAAARSGATVRFVGAVGDDEAGRLLRSTMAVDHVEPVLAASPLPTGRALISVADGGENAIVVVPGANRDAVAGSSVLADSAVILLQLEIPLAVVTEAAVAGRSHGATVVLNPAPAQPLPDRLLGACDVVVPNEHEVELLGGAAAILARGAGAVVTTRGAAGAELVTRDGRRSFPPFPVVPVDTTGAGDAFCGALAARLADGADLADAVIWASAAGALATTVRGAVPAQPTADRIARLVDAAGQG